MAFTASSSNLPDYIRRRQEATKRKWIAIYNLTEQTEGAAVALLVANKWLKTQVVEKRAVARTDVIVDRIEFVVEGPEFLTRTEDGEDYVSFKLADNQTDSRGVKLPDSILAQWAEKINKGDVLLGDVDHQYWLDLLNSGLSEAQIKEKMKEKPSIAKAIKAVFEKGKLWVRAVVDKRYRKIIKESKGVSLEGAVRRDLSGNVLSGDLFGFTFGVNKNPVIPGTEVY